MHRGTCVQLFTGGSLEDMNTYAQRLVAIYSATSIAHLVKPKIYDSVIPTPLQRWSRELIMVSGIAEGACALGLLHPRTRRVAGVASVGLLVAVFPANIQMAIDYSRDAIEEPTPARIGGAVATIARLPLQWTLIQWSRKAR